jgi:hypothetical protein
MLNDVECLEQVVIDVCTKTFLLISDQRNTRSISCENYNQFMDLWKLVDEFVQEDQIAYCEVAITEE